MLNENFENNLDKKSLIASSFLICCKGIRHIIIIKINYVNFSIKIERTLIKLKTVYFYSKY